MASEQKPSIGELLEAWQTKRKELERKLAPLEDRRGGLQSKLSEAKLYAIKDVSAQKSLDETRGALTDILAQTTEFEKAMAECDAAIAELKPRLVQDQLDEIERTIDACNREQYTVTQKENALRAELYDVQKQNAALSDRIRDAMWRRQPLREQLTAMTAGRK